MALVFSFSISSREASIGQQARAGDVAGFGTRQVGDKAGDLIGIAIVLEAVIGTSVFAKSLSAGFMSVSIGPAWTLLTVIPRRPRSRASPFVKPATAPLVSA